MKKLFYLVICALLINSCSFLAVPQSVQMHSMKQNTAAFDMVIIAPETFASEIQPLIDHKNNHDINTFLKTTDDIYQEFQGRDKAEQIKYYIKSAIEEHGIKYVLLIGGRMGQSFRWYIPIRYANIDDGYMHKQVLSDLYFADIYKDNGEFEDWDSNGNGIYSEWTGNAMIPDDPVDLIPDVSVGRLPCRSKQEVIDIIQKIILYETPSVQQDRFQNILLMGGDTNPGIGEPFPYEGESACEWVRGYLPDFHVTSLYVSDGTLTQPTDMITAFNEGFGFVLYHGHGLQDRLETFKPNSTETVEVFHSDYISELYNTQLPVMLVGCCQTTDFDSSVFNFLDFFNNREQHYYLRNVRHECVKECLAWGMVNKIDGGSIAHIGSSSTAWGATGDVNNDGIPDSVQNGFTAGLCTEFFNLYGQGNFSILGDIFSMTLNNIIEEHHGRTNKIQCKCIQEFQLIGDPSLMIGGYR